MSGKNNGVFVFLPNYNYIINKLYNTPNCLREMGLFNHFENPYNNTGMYKYI